MKLRFGVYVCHQAVCLAGLGLFRTILTFGFHKEHARNKPTCKIEGTSTKGNKYIEKNIHAPNKGFKNGNGAGRTARSFVPDQILRLFGGQSNNASGLIPRVLFRPGKRRPRREQKEEYIEEKERKEKEMKKM